MSTATSGEMALLSGGTSDRTGTPQAPARASARALPVQTATRPAAASVSSRAADRRTALEPAPAISASANPSRRADSRTARQRVAVTFQRGHFWRSCSTASRTLPYTFPSPSSWISTSSRTTSICAIPPRAIGSPRPAVSTAKESPSRPRISSPASSDWRRRRNVRSPPRRNDGWPRCEPAPRGHLPLRMPRGNTRWNEPTPRACTASPPAGRGGARPGGWWRRRRSP